MTGGGGVRWLDLQSLTAVQVADLAGAIFAAPAPVRPGESQAYTVTTNSSGRAEDWRPAEWEKVAAREAWRAVLERERVAAVRSACAELLAGLDGLPAERAGRPVTAVALVLGLRR